MPADNAPPYFVCHRESESFVYGMQERPYLNSSTLPATIALALAFLLLAAWMASITWQTYTSPIGASDHSNRQLLIVVMLVAVLVVVQLVTAPEQLSVVCERARP
ncbi:MAG: hypothetical protein U0670_17730 [Anaerolineae bacterium]